MYTIVNNISHEKWLELRKMGIGSSEVGGILGLGHHESQTAYQIWRRKLGLDPPLVPTEAMQMGHWYEQGTAVGFCEKTGCTLVPGWEDDWLAVDTQMPFLRVSPDRLFWKPGEEHTKENWHILECKFSGNEFDPNDIPKAWYCQVQYQLGVMGIKSGALACFSSRPRNHVDFVWIDLDEEFFETQMKPRLKMFWEMNIAQKIAPPPATITDVTLMYPTSEKDKTVEVDATTSGKIAELREIKAQETLLKEQHERLEKDIKEAFGDAEIMKDCNGRILATFKTQGGKDGFNSSRLEAEQPEVYAKYRTQGKPFRTLLLKKPDKGVRPVAS